MALCMILRLQCASEPHGGLVKFQVFLIQLVWGGTPEIAFLIRAR